MNTGKTRMIRFYLTLLMIISSTFFDIRANSCTYFCAVGEIFDRFQGKGCQDMKIYVPEIENCCSLTSDLITTCYDCKAGYQIVDKFCDISVLLLPNPTPSNSVPTPTPGPNPTSCSDSHCCDCSGNTSICLECNEGFWLKKFPTTTCEICHPKCLTCKHYSKCTKCKAKTFK